MDGGAVVVAHAVVIAYAVVIANTLLVTVSEVA